MVDGIFGLIPIYSKTYRYIDCINIVTFLSFKTFAENICFSFTGQIYTTIIITITERPIIIRYSAYKLFVSVNFYSLYSLHLRTRNLS